MRTFITFLILLGYWSGAAQDIINSREEAVALIRELRKIHTPEGIETLEQVELNGEQQWISIRGKNKANPVLLFIHGGPASPVMPLSWSFQNAWEDYFTVVQWDQRVSGKNWVTADTAKAAADLHIKTIVQDGIALVNYLCEKLDQDKVFVMGYSFGASVGIRMTALIPEKLYAYVGVGQTSPGQPEKYLYDRLIMLASESKNEAALQELQSIAPHPRPDGSTPVRNLLTTRKWARYYNGGWYGKPDLNLYFSLPELSPDYTRDEIISLSASTSWTTRKILRQSPGAEFPEAFQAPVIFMMGRNDLHTPYEPTKSYFDQLTAPVKKFYTFERSGHFPMLEEPGRFLVTLVNDILPLAGELPRYSVK